MVDEDGRDIVPEWIAMEVYDRHREPEEFDLTFMELVKKRNWTLSCTDGTRYHL